MKRLRLKDLGTFKTGLTYSPDNICEPNEGVLVLRSANIQDDILDLGDCVYVNNDIPSWMRVKKGDILICSRNGSANLVGKTAIINSDINATWGAFMMLLRTRYNSNYINYLLNIIIRREKARFSTSTINQLTNSMLGGIVVDIFEDAKEQQRIVEYLDAKTTEIDKKIELLGKKRDAYNRLKTATINRAVTRGLDEHVPLKDSGMDWIDQIPEHWEAARIKDVVSEIFMGTSPVYEYEEDNNNFVFGQRNNQLDGINFDDIKFAKDSFFNERQEYEFLKYGDVLINTLGGGSVGRTGYYDKNDDVRVITDGHIMVLRSKTYDTRYMYYYLLSRKERLENMAIGSTNQSFFNVSDVRVIPIPKPSSLEQKQIAAYLDDRCAKIDEAVTIIDKQIDALKRLKRSLINEVVTGKRMV